MYFQVKHNLSTNNTHCTSVNKTHGMRLAIVNAGVFTIATLVEKTCTHRATHTSTLGYHCAIPTGLGFDPDSFTTTGYSPISVIRLSSSHEGRSG